MKKLKRELTLKATVENLARVLAFLEENLEEAADQMMRLALDRGGRDNISLVLAWDENPAEGEAAQ